MREKLIKGRFLSGLKYTSSQNCIFSIENNCFIEVHTKPISISQSHSSTFFSHRSIRTSAVIPEENHKQHRNFVFLPYVPGKITYVRQTGYDVLSGDMTGCLIVRFLMNGVPFIGHIGTHDTPLSSHSLQVKEAWKSAASSGRVQLLDAYDPVDRLPAKAFTSTEDWLASYFAIVDPVGRFYTAVIARDLTSESDDNWKIIGTYRMIGRGPSIDGLL